MTKLLCIGIVLLLLSCNTSEKQTDKNDCDELSIESFKSFIKIDVKTSENQLKNILGKATGGSYTHDTIVFIYEYTRLNRVPINVYLNAESGKIQTISLEVLGLEENFDNDIKKANSKYLSSNCHSLLLGKLPNEIFDLLGKPTEDNLKTDNVEAGVRTLRYLSKDDEIAVRFNFYPSQNYRLSSIVVDWY